VEVIVLVLEMVETKLVFIEYPNLKSGTKFEVQSTRA